MVDDRVTDGRRIAQLLAAEVRGHERGPLAALSVADVADIAGSVDGERAYRLVRPTADGEATVGAAYVHPERVRLVVRARPERAAAAAEDAGLGVRPAGGDAPRTLVFVESGAAVKRATDVLRAVLEGLDDAG